MLLTVLVIGQKSLAQLSLGKFNDAFKSKSRDREKEHLATLLQPGLLSRAAARIIADISLPRQFNNIKVIKVGVNAGNYSTPRLTFIPRVSARTPASFSRALPRARAAGYYSHFISDAIMQCQGREWGAARARSGLLITQRRE